MKTFNVHNFIIAASEHLNATSNCKTYKYIANTMLAMVAYEHHKKSDFGREKWETEIAHNTRYVISDNITDAMHPYIQNLAEHMADNEVTQWALESANENYLAEAEDALSADTDVTMLKIARATRLSYFEDLVIVAEENLSKFCIAYCERGAAG